VWWGCIHSEGVLVVTIADIPSMVASIGAFVKKALGVVDVSVLFSTPRTGGV
jgi:hypothetical protein